MKNECYFSFFLLGSQLTPFCWVLPINLGGIISATGRLAQKLTWGSSFILLKLQDTLYGLSQERAEEKWAWCWEEIRGLQASSEEVEAQSSSLWTRYHPFTANICWLLVTMVPGPMLGAVEPEMEVSASAPCTSKTNIRTSKWLDLFFPSKGILRRQNSLEPSLLTHLAFVKHKKK